MLELTAEKGTYVLLMPAWSRKSVSRKPHLTLARYTKHPEQELDRFARHSDALGLVLEDRTTASVDEFRARLRQADADRDFQSKGQDSDACVMANEAVGTFSLREAGRK